MISGTTEMRIGSRVNWKAQFHGAIDDVAVWNRPLTSDEIRALYNGGAGRPVL